MLVKRFCNSVVGQLVVNKRYVRKRVAGNRVVGNRFFFVIWLLVRWLFAQAFATRCTVRRYFVDKLIKNVK